MYLLQVSDLEINDAHIIRSRWHPKLNQILIGGGDGIVRVFYDPNKSHNGAKLCVGKYFLNQNNVSYNDATCMYYLLIYKDIE